MCTNDTMPESILSALAWCFSPVSCEQWNHWMGSRGDAWVQSLVDTTVAVALVMLLFFFLFVTVPWMRYIYNQEYQNIDCVDMRQYYAYLETKYAATCADRLSTSLKKDRTVSFGRPLWEG